MSNRVLIFTCFSKGTLFSLVHIFPCNEVSSLESPASNLKLITGDFWKQNCTYSRRTARLHCLTVVFSFNQLTYTFSLQKRATALVQSLLSADSLHQDASCLLDDSVRLSWQVVVQLCAHFGALTYTYSSQLLQYRGYFFYASLYINLYIYINCISMCRWGFFTPAWLVTVRASSSSCFFPWGLHKLLPWFLHILVPQVLPTALLHFVLFFLFYCLTRISWTDGWCAGTESVFPALWTSPLTADTLAEASSPFPGPSGSPFPKVWLC